MILASLVVVGATPFRLGYCFRVDLPLPTTANLEIVAFVVVSCLIQNLLVKAFLIAPIVDV